ncbi:MAG: sulfurtransferase TusA family protein [Trichlorobacter sp.]|nr:sulfurtransferase TusA family protein [Trichlorobacter sp.]
MNHVINMLGNLCPAPLDALIKAVETASVGDTFTIDFDCAQAIENIPLWCANNSCTVLELTKTGDAQWQIIVQKD